MNDSDRSSNCSGLLENCSGSTIDSSGGIQKCSSQRCPIRRFALYRDSAIMSLNELINDRHAQSSTFRRRICCSYITRVSSPKMKITAGNVEVLMKEMDEEKSIFVETGSGGISVFYKQGPKSLELLASSKSSDITVDLQGFKKETHTEDSMKGKIGEATKRLEIISESGVIHVK